jgi:methylthioribose-1-phosphate isomerase
MSVPRSVAWEGDARSGRLLLLDQTRLPHEELVMTCGTLDAVVEAIKSLRVRGAPAIGVAAAYGVIIGLQARLSVAMEDAHTILPIHKDVPRIAGILRAARPTAVNLAWALDRMESAAHNYILGHGRDRFPSMFDALLAQAQAIQAEDIATCRAISEAGAALIPDGAGILTHCNTGALATADYGTALGAMFVAAEQGKKFTAYVDETRPLLQGARLTTWELQRRGIDAVLICDNMAAQVMKEQRIQLVLVGADRIAANGDTANKIGTYGVAVLAQAHNIPFYVAAPKSSFDLTLQNGDEIPIEQRPATEVTEGFGKATAPPGIRVYNPAFDVTPARLISGIVTERGLITPVTQERIREVLTG